MSNFSDIVEAAESSIKRLNACAASLGKADTDEKALNSEATKLGREVETVVRRLDTDAKAAAPSLRREMLESVSSLRVSLQAARTALQKANDVRARVSLLKPDKAKAMEEASVDKLEAAAKKSALNTARLQSAQAQMNDTQDIGVRLVLFAGVHEPTSFPVLFFSPLFSHQIQQTKTLLRRSVITNLTSQRETLLRAQDGAGNVTALAGEAKGLLQRMMARALTNKILLFITVLVLLGANGAVVFLIISGK